MKGLHIYTALLLCILWFITSCAGTAQTPPDSGSGGMPVERVKQSSYSFEDAMEIMSDIEADAFTLPARGGGEISLVDFDGQILLLCFTEAKNDMNDSLLELLDGATKRGDLEPLLIVHGEGEAIQGDVPFPVASDADSSVFSRRCYYAEATPVCYLVDRNGIIRLTVPGVANDEMLEALMDYMRALDE